MNLMVDLDSLKDTRLITLSKLVPKEKIKVEEWQRRIDDVAFYTDLGITYEQFQQEHSKRKIEDLKDDHTLPTATPMSNFIRDDLRAQVTDFSMDGNRLYVNTYPYVFNKYQKDVLIQTLRESFFTYNVIELVHVSRSAATPDFMRQRDILFYVTYDGFNWYNQHADQLMESPMPAFELITPKLLHSKRDTSEDIKAPPGEDPFDLLQAMYAIHLKFMFEPVSLWCLRLN